MSLAMALKQPGVHALMLEGEVDLLEAELTVPSQMNPRYIAILGHPHSLQGGTMHNKVVTTLVRTFRDLEIACLRFNFRGVGLSEGHYADGFGESKDMVLLAEQCLHADSSLALIFAGFSFGSYVAYRAAAQLPHRLLITVAPSVEHFDYFEFSAAPPRPWVVVHGANDEVVPMSSVVDFCEKYTPPLPLLCFEDTTHFFHSKLIDLKEQLTPIIQHNLDDVS